MRVDRSKLLRSFFLASIAALGAFACSASGNQSSESGGFGGQTTSANAGAGAGSSTTQSGSSTGGFTTSSGSTGTGGTSSCDNAGEKTSVGCEYYSVNPDISLGAHGGCFAAYVVNPWTFPVTVDVDFKGQSLDASTFGYIPKGSGANIVYTPLTGAAIPPGEVAILFLNRKGVSPPGSKTDCPTGITPAITNVDAAQHNTGIGAAFHIKSSAPVSAYDIYPYGGGQSALTSATLLLPTNSWGDNYIVVSAFGNGLPFGDVPTLGIVSQADGTTVTIAPTVAINASADGSVAGSPAGTPITYTLDKGEHLNIAQGKALDGSVIQASAPVGVWGGMTSLAIEACCDESAHQQIPPIRAFGSEYVGVRYRNRYDGTEESPPWRIFGAADGTQLVWEPSTPSGAPTTLNQGSVAQFDSPGGFVVHSQDDMHPFYMSAHMTGAAMFDPSQTGNMTGPADGRGDAEFVNMIPPGEYMNKYVFFTDPTYPETNLVLVRAKDQGGSFDDVTLDCAGVLSGWQPVGSAGKYEYLRADLVRHNFQSQMGCDNGRHEIHSDGLFGLTVWGWGNPETGDMISGFYSQYVSYAYPGGASVAPINNVVVPVIK